MEHVIYCMCPAWKGFSYFVARDSVESRRSSATANFGKERDAKLGGHRVASFSQSESGLDSQKRQPSDRQVRDVQRSPPFSKKARLLHIYKRSKVPPLKHSRSNRRNKSSTALPCPALPQRQYHSCQSSRQARNAFACSRRYLPYQYKYDTDIQKSRACFDTQTHNASSEEITRSKASAKLGVILRGEGKAYKNLVLIWQRRNRDRLCTYKI